MSTKTTRIGLVGYGQIGRAVHQMIDASPETGMRVVFIHDQFTDALKDVPELGTVDLEGLSRHQTRSRNGSSRCNAGLGQDHLGKNGLHVYFRHGWPIPRPNRRLKKQPSATARCICPHGGRRHGRPVGKPRCVGIR